MTDNTSTPSNFVHARAAIVWILALVAAFGGVWWIEQESGKALIAQDSAHSPRALHADEMARARAAWAWFEQHPSPAAAAQARYTLVAVVSARELGLIDAAAADSRLRDAVQSIAGSAQAPDLAAQAAANATVLERLALIQRGTTQPSP